MTNTYKNRARVFRRALLACSAKRAEMGRELVRLRARVVQLERLLVLHSGAGVTYGHA